MVTHIKKTFSPDIRYPNQTSNSQIHNSFIFKTTQQIKPITKKISQPKQYQCSFLTSYYSNLYNHCKNIKRFIQQQNQQLYKYNLNKIQYIRKSQISENKIFNDNQFQSMSFDNKTGLGKHKKKINFKQMNQKSSDLKKQVQQNRRWAQGNNLQNLQKNQNKQKFQSRKYQISLQKLQYFKYHYHKSVPTLKTHTQHNHHNKFEQIKKQLNCQAKQLQNRLLNDKRYNFCTSQFNVRRIQSIYQSRLMKFAQKICKKKRYGDVYLNFCDDWECEYNKQSKQGQQDKKISYNSLQVHEGRIKQQRKRLIQRLKV